MGHGNFTTGIALTNHGESNDGVCFIFFTE